MANEINVSANLTLTNGNVAIRRVSNTLQVTQTGTGAKEDFLSIATSDTVVALGSLSNSGWAWFKNCDATNYVDIGPDATGMIAFMRLYPGEFCVLRLSPAAVIKAKAHTAAVKLQYSILEN